MVLCFLMPLLLREDALSSFLSTHHQTKQGIHETQTLCPVLHLDANKVDGDDGPLQGGQTGFVQSFSHHHLGGHTDEVHADGFGHKREGARRPQVTLNHLEHMKRRTTTPRPWIGIWRWFYFGSDLHLMQPSGKIAISFSHTLRKHYLPWHHCL